MRATRGQHVTPEPAAHTGLLDEEAYLLLVRRKKEKLARVGIEDLNLRGNHLLLSLDGSGGIVRDGAAVPEVRICNFELLKTLSGEIEK